MDNKELKGLSEAYNEVYSDNLEQLSEAPFGLNPLDYLPGNSPSAVRQRQKWAKEGETQRARERATRATQERVDLGVAKKGNRYVATPGGTSYDNEKSAQAVTLANRLNKETGLGKPQTPTKPVERKPPTTTPAASRLPPRPAAPAPQPTRTQRPSTGLSTPASSPRPTAAPSPRPTAAPAPRPAAPSSLSTGGRRSNSELEGKTFATRATSGGTKYEVRAPTSAELAAARNAGGGEAGVKAAVARSSNLMSGPSLTPIAAAVKPTTPINTQRKTPTKTPIPEMNSYDFGKPDRITQDVASLYQSIYEAEKKVDQDKDGDNDFADIQIAKMVASGMPLKDAIAAVRNKSYNKKAELGEGRTEDLKRKYTAKYGKLEYPTDTLRLNKTRRAYEKASRDNQDGYGPNPRTAIKGKQNLGQAMYKAGQSARVINAEFELWVNELLDEGYDLSDYTVDEMYEIFEESEKKLRPASERTKTAKTRAQITAERAKERAAEKKADALERAAQKVINQTQGRSGRVSENPMGSEAPAAKEAAPNREDVTTQIEPGEAGSNKHQRAHRALKAAQSNEDFNLWVNDLLDEGYNLSDYTWDELYEGYQELTESPYQIFGPDPKGPSDSKEIKLGKPYNDRKTARRRADKLDQEIGGYRHSVRKITKESYELYNLVIGHLLDEGFADDCDSANMMIERMSDEWLNEILESKN